MKKDVEKPSLISDVWYVVKKEKKYWIIPLLVLLLGTVGLSAAVGWLDYVLLPALAAFLGITIFAVVRRQRFRNGQ